MASKARKARFVPVLGFFMGGPNDLTFDLIVPFTPDNFYLFV